MVVVPPAPWERKGSATSRKGTVTSTAGNVLSLGDCFVISPIDKRNPRIAAVFNDLIAPACKRMGFEAKRADHIAGEDRISVITGCLARVPLVIAYLGNPQPYWNPDVMLEVGYRYATGLPIVLISEAPARGRRKGTSFKELLPFTW